MDIYNHTTEMLAALVEKLPIGTNYALYQLLWMLISGKLLNSRGAIFPALQALGLDAAASRRVWNALRGGAWQIKALLDSWHRQVEAQGKWQAYQYAGYYVTAVDLSAYWRPALQGLKSQHYDRRAGKALRGIVLGLFGRVGHVGKQRLAVLTDVLHADLQQASEQVFYTQVIRHVAQTLAPDELAVFDAGFKLKALLAAGIWRFVVRLPKNFTARRNVLPEYQGGRPPKYGTLVRPLARTYKGKSRAATPPDHVETWQQQGLSLRAEFWYDLVLPSCQPSPDNDTFTVVAIYDPRFSEPWLLACPLRLSGPEMAGIYHARWPIEQLPLAAKHMVGAQRQFVSAPQSCYRLPELSLLAGSILSYLAATAPPIPTGFWDRAPKATPGRLRRWLLSITFANLPPLIQHERIRQKASVTTHLPKGILAHRRAKRPMHT